MSGSSLLPGIPAADQTPLASLGIHTCMAHTETHTHMIEKTNMKKELAALPQAQNPPFGALRTGFIDMPTMTDLHSLFHGFLHPPLPSAHFPQVQRSTFTFQHKPILLVGDLPVSAGLSRVMSFFTSSQCIPVVISHLSVQISYECPVLLEEWKQLAV